MSRQDGAALHHVDRSFREYVEKMDDGHMECKFCGHLFHKDTAITRIRLHIAGVKGRGVRICGQVPQDVQEAALAAIQFGVPREKKLETGAGSSNNEGMEQGWEKGRVCSHLDMENTGEGSVQHVDRIVPPTIDENYNRREATERLVQPGIGASSFGVCGNHNAISTSQQEQNNEGENVAGDAGTTPATATMGHAPGRSLEEVMRSFEVCLMEDDNGTGGVAQPGAGASSSGGLRHNRSENRGAPLLTGSTRLVGQAFEENRDVIWSWLTDDEVSTIGIYGMGGAGKTTMVKHIYNKLLQSPDISRHVYWVTVSQDFSIHKLQNKIAKRIQLSFCNEEEELEHRAEELSQELMKKKRWILILDDLWKSFELHKVGIPVPFKGCKLILTTRSEAVCRQMNSINNVRVNPLSNEEAWTLFVEELGHDKPLSPQVERVARDITRECAGLPLGIKTIAGTMKGVDGMHEWRDALEDLKQSKVPQDRVEEEVFRILRFSYTHLRDITLQQCFLYCGLFPEDFEIHREDLINYLIGEGLVKWQKSREATINKGHTMLDRLERACLLERLGGGDCVKMHDLIRDMAIQILQENSQAMVKAGAQLRELPDEEEWTENFTRVSLMHNKIKEIPSSHSPRCPNLSTKLKGLVTSSFGVCGNHNAISTSQQEQNKEVYNNEVTNSISASAQQQNNEMMMTHQRGDLSLEDWMASITVEDEDLQVIGSFHERPSFNQADEPRGDPSQPTNDQLCSPSVNNDVIVNDAQQREPMFPAEYEWANDLIGGGIELGRYTPETNPETDHCSPEELPHDEFQTLPRTEPVVQVLEQSNAEHDNLSVDAGSTQVGVQGMEQGGEEGRVCSHLDTGEGSVQHVDRIVPPTINENYNRREATERLVQPEVCASAFVFYGNINAISTSQQEQNNEVDNVAGDEGTTPAAATRGHTPGRYFEEFSRWFVEDDEDEEPGEDEELLGPGRKRMAQLKSGWTLLLTSLILEIASVVFDQLGYALVGMVLAFVALPLATAELLIHMAPKERTSLLPSYLRPSTTHSHGTKGKKTGGTIVEYFGLVGAVWQCVYSTVAYAYAR